MNIKSITTLGLVAVALAVTIHQPAEAASNNNNDDSNNGKACGSISSPRYNHLSQEVAGIRARLYAGNLSNWEANRLEKKLANINLQQDNLTTNS